MVDLTEVTHDSVLEVLRSSMNSEVDPNAGECMNSFLVAGCTLDNKLRAKIIDGEYVDIGALQPRNTGFT